MKKDLLIVVPYRNRDEHIKSLLEHTPAYFNQQNLTYDILLCELDNIGDWNAGLTVNSLISFIPGREYKWLYIHHVDVWPEAGVWVLPPEDTAYYNLGDHGSFLLTMDAFIKVKGYSNSFWGWGAEDNELINKLREGGYKILSGKDHYPVKFNTGFQNHSRKFNGKNYAGNIKEICLVSSDKKNNIEHFAEHAYVRDLKQRDENLYHQIVVSLKKSPDQTANSTLLIGYLKNHNKPENVVSFIKSASMHAAYEFDIAFCIADKDPSEEFIKEVSSYGVNCFRRPATNETNLFFDRYEAYLDFLLQNPQYKFILHVDVTDSFFQRNPFIDLDREKLTLTSEGMLIKDEPWNVYSLKSKYGESVLQQIQDNYILCGGVIGGKRELFIEFIQALLREYDSLYKNHEGYDQTFCNKLVYHDKILYGKIDIKQLEDNYCIHLHVYKNNNQFPKQKVIIPSSNNKVLSEDQKKYAIVHQYNRISDLYNNIKSWYKKMFWPIF